MAGMEEDLKSYRESLEEEYDAARNIDLDTVRTATASKLLTAVPRAVEHILYLAEHAEKDTTQLAACKFIIDRAFDSKVGDDDALTKLLEEITKND